MRGAALDHGNVGPRLARCPATLHPGRRPAEARHLGHRHPGLDPVCRNAGRPGEQNFQKVLKAFPKRVHALLPNGEEVPRLQLDPACERAGFRLGDTCGHQFRGDLPGQLGFQLCADGLIPAAGSGSACFLADQFNHASPEQPVNQLGQAGTVHLPMGAERVGEAHGAGVEHLAGLHVVGVVDVSEAGAFVHPQQAAVNVFPGIAGCHLSCGAKVPGEDAQARCPPERGVVRRHSAREVRHSLPFDSVRATVPARGGRVNPAR